MMLKRMKSNSLAAWLIMEMKLQTMIRMSKQMRLNQCVTNAFTRGLYAIGLSVAVASGSHSAILTPTPISLGDLEKPRRIGRDLIRFIRTADGGDDGEEACSAGVFRS
jgi:hypothetical protein